MLEPIALGHSQTEGCITQTSQPTRVALRVWYGNGDLAAWLAL